MKLPILDLTKKEIGQKELPKQFDEPFRPDMIRRAVLATQSAGRQPYGSDPEAGKRVSAKLSKRRRAYRGSYGHGISRVPRKILSRRGTRMNWVGAFAPGTVGGRRAHPPKASKIWQEKINKKERRAAIRSALAASVSKDIVAKRGHKVPDNYPFIIENKVESLAKTKDVIKSFAALGLVKEMERAAAKKVRAGTGKSRGRKYKKKIGPLLVVSQKCKLVEAARNIPGTDVIEVGSLNATLLAPGTMPGRLTLFTEAAIDKIEKDKLFI